ncbi:hypothetical protein PC129_g16969 [Phytophthora cactorum]|uniref:Uncharacterized protein n=1 Tax=Phytophthora cactorum TaxID=29920 RepID=A0A8T1HJB6_9STRA|nr:hypothetical protein PC129_g16969 [Phytophthora cactorum]
MRVLDFIVLEQQVICAAPCSCTLPHDTQGCDALTSERTAYVEKQVRCTVLSPGDNQGNESNAPSSLQTPECSVPVSLPAEPGQDAAWTVASNAAKAQPEQDTASCCQQRCRRSLDKTPRHLILQLRCR